MSGNRREVKTTNGALHRVCSLGVILLLAVTVGCARKNIEATPVNQKIDSLEVTTLSIGDRTVTVTLDDLERIRGALLQWLGEHSENPDLDQLRRVTSTERCFITHDGVARIGAWMLRSRAGKPILERTVPRSPGTTFVPVAVLVSEDGNWEVLDVSAVVLRGR